MSYTEYLRRKAAGMPVVIDTTPKKMEASQYIEIQKQKANAQFFTSSRVGVITNTFDPTGKQKVPSVNAKASGGRVPDASSFSAFAGSSALRKDLPSTNQKLIANSNTAGSISGCTTIPEPVSLSANGGVYAPNVVAVTASQATKTHKCGTQSHIASELGPPLFVDAMDHKLKPLCPANHTHPTPFVPNRYQPRPAVAYIGPVVSSETGFKVGAARARPRYVERTHGNPSIGHPTVSTPYKLGNAPPHLKINDPPTMHIPFR